MTDPFSVSAGVVGVVSLGLTVGQGLVRYYAPWRDYDDEIRGFTTKVDGLLRTIHLLKNSLSPENEIQVHSYQIRVLVLDHLASCKEACERLEKMLEECKSNNLNDSPSPSTRKRDWLRLKRVAYPFKKETLVTLSELVSGLRDNLSLALHLLTIAMMGQQHRQVEDLARRTTSIDLRTTTILTTLEQQQRSTSSNALVQIPTSTSKATQASLRTMPEPSLLRDLCDQQQLMNSWLRRKRGMPASQMEQISQHCTCRQKPQFLSGRRGSNTEQSVPPGYSLSTYALHEQTCVMHVAGQLEIGVAGSYTFCSRFLGFSVQVMMGLTRGAGSFALGQRIRTQAVVPDKAPAFDYVTSEWILPAVYIKGFKTVVEETKTALFCMFRDGVAAPTDRLDDGRTILHVLFSTYLVSILQLKVVGEEQYTGSGFMDLVKALIDVGVPFNERTLAGHTPSDRLIRHMSLREQPIPLSQHDEKLAVLQMLLDSGAYLNSFTAAEYDEHWNSSTAEAARFLLPKFPDRFECLEIEIAILSKSTDSLERCLASYESQSLDEPAYALLTAYFELLHLAVDWPNGLVTLLESPIRESATQIKYWFRFERAIGDCFETACAEGKIEGALILLRYIEFVTSEHLRAAALSKDMSLLTEVISALVESRQGLQKQALKHLPDDVLRSLSLPTTALLDTKTCDVFLALKNYNFIDVQPSSYYRSSVYGYANADRAVFERLYAAGFTDLNQTHENSITTLFDFSNRQIYKHDPYNLIKIADWLIAHGANLHQFSDEGYSWILYLADCFGFKFASWYQQPEADKDLPSLEVTDHADTIGLIGQLMTDDSGDDCVCACSNVGCTPLQQVLRGFYRLLQWGGYHKHMYPITALGTLIDILQDPASSRLTKDQRLVICHQMLRSLTFDALEMTHTCHTHDTFYDASRVGFEKMDDGEILEIREEESLMIRRLDELMVELTAKYDELGLGLHDFLEEYWRPRMDEVIYAAEEVDLEEQQRVQELGIILA